MKGKKKNIEKDEDMSMTFISDVGQKSAIADDTLSDISGVYDIKVDPTDEKNKIEDSKEEDFNIMNDNTNKRSIFITVILMIICLTVGSIGTYFFINMSKKEVVKTDNKEVKEKIEEKAEEISPDSIYIKELISSYENDSISYPYYQYLYSNDKVSIKELDEDFLKILASQKANNNLTVTSFSGNRFQDSVKLLYGNQVKFENGDISFDKGCIKLIYDEDEDIYRSKLGECGGTTTLQFNKKITKAIKEDDNLKINVAINYIVDDEIYKSYDFEEKKGIEKLEDTNIDRFDIDKDYIDLDQYQYTFLYDKENLNYYLTTIEKIK